MESPFYATARDLLHVCTHVAERIPLRFDRTGWFVTATLNPVHLPAESDLRTEVPHVGYLLTRANAAVAARRVETAQGTRFFVDELLNPESASLVLGYRPSTSLLTPGSIGTTSAQGEGVQIVREFRKAMTKHFTKVRAYWVGAEALALRRAGGRLGLSEQSPPEFDLLLGEHDA
jgi:hypothetical protein